MSISAPKRTAVRTSSQGRTAKLADPFDRRGDTGDDRAGALIASLRAVLTAAGVEESRSDAEHGFYFVALGNTEISVQYNEVSHGRRSASSLSRRNELALLSCCYALAGNDYAFTLFMSPRTLELHVSFE